MIDNTIRAAAQGPAAAPRRAAGANSRRPAVDTAPGKRTPEKVEAGVRLTSPEPSSEGGHIPGTAGSLVPCAFHQSLSHARGAFARKSVEAMQAGLPCRVRSSASAGSNSGGQVPDVAAAPFRAAGDDPDVAGNVTGQPHLPALPHCAGRASRECSQQPRPPVALSATGRDRPLTVQFAAAPSGGDARRISHSHAGRGCRVNGTSLVPGSNLILPQVEFGLFGARGIRRVPKILRRAKNFVGG